MFMRVTASPSASPTPDDQKYTQECVPSNLKRIVSLFKQNQRGNNVEEN